MVFLSLYDQTVARVDTRSVTVVIGQLPISEK